MNRASQQHPHERLVVWQDAMLPMKAVYRWTERLPDTGRFRWIGRMRRAAASIPTDIADSTACRSTTEFLRFPSMARGSLAQLDTRIFITARSGFAAVASDLDEVRQRTFTRINALMHSLDSRGHEGAAIESPIPNPQSRPHHA